MKTGNQAENQCGNHNGDQEERQSVEELQLREYSAAFLWLAGLMGFALFLKVPLGMSPKGSLLAHAKAPWIFGGIQELLFYTPAGFAGILFPFFSFILLLSLPWWGRGIKTRWVNLSVFILLGIWLLLTSLYVWS